MKIERAEDVIAMVFAEMRHRASEGCQGTHDGTCCDPDLDIDPEYWCNRCLMGAAVQAAEEGKADGVARRN